MAKEPYFLSREALYIKVWETPTVKLAKEFGVSDVAVGKMCKKLDIPKPPLGYWRKVQTGQKKIIPPLSKPKEKIQTGVWIYPRSEERTLKFEEEYKEQTLAVEQKIAEKLNNKNLPEIKVSESLYKPHPLIVQTQKAFSKKETDSYGALWNPYENNYLNLRISRQNLQRALLIMDALIKGLEKTGGRVSIEKNNQGGSRTEFKIDEIKLKISLREDFKRFERKITAEDKKKNPYDYHKYYYEPSGIFTFTAEGDYRIHRNWRDGKTSQVEDHLNDIVVGIFRLAEECRREEIDRKNEERRELKNAVEYEKRKIIQKKELERRELLETLSARWRKSRDLVDFIKGLEAKLIEEKDQIAEDSNEAQLMSWAYNHAAQMNPILNGQTDELMAQFKKRFDEPEEEDSYEYSELLWKLKLLNQNL